MIGTRRYTLPAAPAVEHRAAFDCFGGRCSILISDRRRPADAARAVAEAKRSLLGWHRRFSRFEPDSELTRFNRDPRPEVTVSPMLARLIEAAIEAWRSTGGLVDATLGSEIVSAGYAADFDQARALDLEQALAAAPARAAAGPKASAGTQPSLHIDGLTVSRSPTTNFDPGGIAKGVFADVLAERLGAFDAFAVDCAGDVRVGGGAGWRRPVQIAAAFEAGTVHTFSLAAAGVATSGIGRRSWIDADGSPAHHLLDPRTGRPAFTGVVQATALAPTAAEAEARAKAAVLSGPAAAAQWLPHGGVVVTEDGGYEVLEPAREETPAVL